MQYSVVIPVYNSDESLIEISDRIKVVFEKIKKSYEIIFVDDGSENSVTWITLQMLVASHPEVIAIRLTRNFGKHSAVLCGFKNAGGEYVIMMDDDLQHLPEEIPLLIAQNGHDIVIGAFDKKSHSAFKIVTSRIKNWLDYKLIEKPQSLQIGAFQLFKRYVVEEICKLNILYPYIPAYLFFISRDVVNVKLTHAPRKFGKTGYDLKKLLVPFSHLIISNSSFLLRSVSYIGLLSSLGSFLLIIYYLYLKFFVGVNVAGWTTLIVVNLFVGGVIMFSIGVLGEYFLRILKGIEARPAYIVKQVINGKES